MLEAVTAAGAASAHHKWQLELSGDIVTVSGDEERLYHVLANLSRRDWPIASDATSTTHCWGRVGA